MNYLKVKDNVNFILNNNLIYSLLNKSIFTPFGEVKVYSIDNIKHEVLATIVNSKNNTYFLNTTILLFIEKYIMTSVVMKDNSIINTFSYLKDTIYD